MQVLHPANLAGSGIEELGGDGLGQGVISLLLVARHEVVAVLHNHLVESGYLVGRILQVGIHGDDHVALDLLESAVERRALAIIAAELDATHVLRLLAQTLDDVP